jgi:glutathione S-transferase
MKLYMHPLSTTSRTVAFFVADNNIDVEQQVVDLFAGEHLKPPYATMNPNCLVPMLEDGDLRLTESSAILKYIADKANSPAYPKDLKQRAKVNEMMDWLNTNFYIHWGYGLHYPQLFPTHKRRSEEAQAATIEWGKENAKKWLKILNDYWLGTRRPYLCGEEITIADYFGAELVGLGESIRCDLAAYPNVERWFNRMKSRPGWAKANEPWRGMCESLKDRKFVALG